MPEITIPKRGNFGEWRKTEPYIGEDGIYVPRHEYVYEGTATEYELFMTKEIFQEAFKEYIVKEGLLHVPGEEQNHK